MSKIPADYAEKVYAGWLGKIIGVRHGGNVENWTYERLKETYGEITGYLHEFKNFAADDDTNGPIFFLRTLQDFTHTSEITAEQFGLTWLNYVPDGHGFFWWGGCGISTEHTAYVNLKNGITAPRSGSIEQNGVAVAEQIGGQIFIDVWGLIAPGNPSLAAEYAEKAAVVSHDGNGKYGGMFLAACIAEAFVEKDIERIIEAGLSVIPSDSEYVRMTRSVVRFYKQHPNWRDCFAYVRDHFGYDRYPGGCHIIPNSAVIVLSLLYGGGDFSRTINICNMCGWDTDCNVGNAGTIMGVRNGLEGIGDEWRKPINDFLCCSSVVGSLNILDIPWCAAYIAGFGYKIAGEEIPAQWASIMNGEAPRFHFEYPGSTHAFRLDWDADWHADWHVTGHVKNTTEAAASGTRSLKVVFDRVGAGLGFRAFHKTYYRPNDFNDSRYDPAFSPILYPGQTVSAQVMLPSSPGGAVARLYVKGTNNKRYYGKRVSLRAKEWTNLTFTIPAMEECLEEAGIEFIPGGSGTLIAFIDHMHFSGKPCYSVHFAKEKLEQWSVQHREIPQFTYLRGDWHLEDGELSGSCTGEPAECYSGDLNWQDYRFEAEVIPKQGHNHHVQFRVQGGIRSYAVGLAPDNQVALYKNENGYRLLASVPFEWKHGVTYKMSVAAVHNKFIVSIQGQFLFDYIDRERPYTYGAIGFSNFHGSLTHYKGFIVEGM